MKNWLRQRWQEKEGRGLVASFGRHHLAQLEEAPRIFHRTPNLSIYLHSEGNPVLTLESRQKMRAPKENETHLGRGPGENSQKKVCMCVCMCVHTTTCPGTLCSPKRNQVFISALCNQKFLIAKCQLHFLGNEAKCSET